MKNNFPNQWQKIIANPAFTLGRRELLALKKFVPRIAAYLPPRLNLFHLGIGTGREIPLLLNLPAKIVNYVLNDMNQTLLPQLKSAASLLYPHIHFKTAPANIMRASSLHRLLASISGRKLIALIGNGTLLADPRLNASLQRAARRHDLLLITIESPHAGMYRSYRIKPFYDFLKCNFGKINPQKIKMSYSRSSRCLEINYQNRLLLSSYKPTAAALRARLYACGFKPLRLIHFPNLHMIGGLFEKE